MPTSGELTPVNSQGTPLYITYKPRAYGRKHRAKLIVQVSTGFMHWKNYNAFLLHMQSESNEWCYEIVGKVPSLPRPMQLNQQLQRSPIKI